jgi:hypothetical protein
MINNIEIIGGGTVSHFRNHLALTAPAYGNTARKIHRLLQEGGHHHDYNLHLNLTKMANAGSGNLETGSKYGALTFLAKKYGVVVSCIFDIVKGNHWR